MVINTTARNTTIKNSFINNAEKKLAKLERFFGDDVAVYITVTHTNGREKVEISIKASNMTFRAEKTTSDRLDSLDAVVDALFKQIVRNKKKLEKRLHKQAFESDYTGDFVGSEDSFEVVKSKKFELKPMDIDEAILQMNLVGHNFFMFLNSDTNKISVVYLRDDGKYGLIEPSGE